LSKRIVPSSSMLTNAFGCDPPIIIFYFNINNIFRNSKEKALTLLLGPNNIKLWDDKVYRLKLNQCRNQRPSLTAKAKAKTKSRLLDNYLPSGKD
jgi:hypothetical protein